MHEMSCLEFLSHGYRRQERYMNKIPLIFAGRVIVFSIVCSACNTGFNSRRPNVSSSAVCVSSQLWQAGGQVHGKTSVIDSACVMWSGTREGRSPTFSQVEFTGV